MLKIREATPSDAALIFDFIYQLAVYEKMEDQVFTSKEELEKNIFQNGYAKVIIAEENNIPVGFALYFFNFSTFDGKPGIYLEDLFVLEEHRGKGYGKKLFIELAKIAQEKGASKIKWSVLDWNLPSINFYKSLGANPMDEWITYCLNGNELDILAKNK